MKVIRNDFYNETLYVKQLNNGLTVYLMPRCEYTNFSAVLMTKFGAFDTEFIPIDENDYIKTPEGVAHFLEHKMFEDSDGSDVSEKFLEMGIESNAYTTYNITSYLIYGLDNLEKGVIKLLDFVQSPAFTNESVEAEKEIINQELLMYKESPLENAKVKHLKLLYGDNNKITKDIGGTIKSVNSINKDILMKCYNTFYNPANMSLSVVGNFDPDELIKLIENNQSKKEFPKFKDPKSKKDVYFDNDSRINEVDYDDIKTPIAMLGIKFPYLDIDQDKASLYAYALDFLFDAYFGEYSNIVERLRERKIYVPLNYRIAYSDGYGYFTTAMTSNDYEEGLLLTEEILNELIEKGLDEDKLKLMKRSCYTRLIKRLNNNGTISEDLAVLHLKQRDLFSGLELCSKVTLNDINDVIELIKNKKICTYVVKPKEKQTRNN